MFNEGGFIALFAAVASHGTGRGLSLTRGSAATTNVSRVKRSVVLTTKHMGTTDGRHRCLARVAPRVMCRSSNYIQFHCYKAERERERVW